MHVDIFGRTHSFVQAHVILSCSDHSEKSRGILSDARDAFPMSSPLPGGSNFVGNGRCRFLGMLEVVWRDLAAFDHRFRRSRELICTSGKNVRASMPNKSMCADYSGSFADCLQSSESLHLLRPTSETPVMHRSLPLYWDPLVDRSRTI